MKPGTKRDTLSPLPDRAEIDGHFLLSVEEYIQRMARARALRDELETCRRIGKARRHAERLRRIRGGDTDTTEGEQP